MTDRLTELLAQKRALEAEGRDPDPELLGRIAWHKAEVPSRRGDYEPGLPLTEQTWAFQEYLRGYEKEAARQLGGGIDERV